MNDNVKSPMCPIRDCVAEVRDRDTGDGISLLEGFESALVGTYRNEFDKVIAVYEEGLILDIIRNRLKEERPDASNDDLDADSADLLGDLARTIPYMGAGAPIIMEGLDRDTNTK